MYKITCDYCFEDNFFSELEMRPVVCANCNSPVNHLEIKDLDEIPNLEIEGQNKKQLDGLTLISEKTKALIEIPHSEITVLGRQNVGGEVFADIPQISREHCKIEYLDGNYVLTDLDSLNGTFIGQAKRDCRKRIQVKIKDNDVIYLGKEAFIVRLKYRTLKDDEAILMHEIHDELKIRKFKCRACGKIHNLNLIICDACGSYGQVEALDD